MLLRIILVDAVVSSFLQTDQMQGIRNLPRNEQVSAFWQLPELKKQGKDGCGECRSRAYFSAFSFPHREPENRRIHMFKYNVNFLARQVPWPLRPQIYT